MGDKRVMFGTDGVRDIANTGNMTPETAIRLGRAYAEYLSETGGSSGKPRIVIGRDTRISGTMTECALAAGMMSAGADVLSIGVIPTPGVSFAVKHFEADGGSVVSASHNPAEYNGIKFLDSAGSKLSDEAELRIEELAGGCGVRPTHGDVGTLRHIPEAVKIYAEHTALLLTCGAIDGTQSARAAFDCANGAASAVMPPLLDMIGADRQPLNDVLTGSISGLSECLIGADPDGMNINDGVGVMCMEHIADYVRGSVFDIGFAFDGDADRVLAADSAGRIIDGDIILWVLARWLKKRGLLGSGVVATVMSSMALEDHLAKDGIEVFRCPVGDRYVLETMRREGARLGGEQSGHIIADAFASTGDGLCTAMLFLNALHDLNIEPSSLTEGFGRYPQKLSNIRLKGSLPPKSAIDEAASEAGELLGGSGRIFIRPSGTEPLLRILVEHRDGAVVEKVSAMLTERLSRLC